jgi:alanine dehydrogenase
MHKELGERRDFLPELVEFLDGLGVAGIVLEHGYGSGMGVPEGVYLSRSRLARIASYEETLAQDMVAVIRCPEADVVRGLRTGTTLVSMLHYASHPRRVSDLLERGINGVSLDAIVDDAGRRLVENTLATAWNGVHSAFTEIGRLHPRFAHADRHPLRVTCLGSGTVGGHAVHAATRYGDPQLREEMVARNVPGVEVTVVDFDLTWHEAYMLDRLEQTDLLIDATQRVDRSRPVIPNDWIAAIPADGVILDLAADPYDFEERPPIVKGVEGVPLGDLDQYVFDPSDPAYDALDPRIDTTNRRLALSCYSWPGVDPVACMRVYEQQIEPVLSALLGRADGGWDEEHASRYERAVARSEVTRWSRTATA